MTSDSVLTSSSCELLNPKSEEKCNLSVADNARDRRSTMWIALLLLAFGSAGLIYVTLRRSRHFWRRLGVEQGENPNVLLGDHPMSNAAVVLGKTSVYDGSVEIYNRFKHKRYFGVYGFPSSPPILVVNDLDLINHILGESTRKGHF